MTLQVLKEEVRAKIFDAAVKAFYETDFRSTKLKSIAKEAGVTVGLIYSYFENKEALYDAVVNSVYFNFRRALEAEEEIEGNPAERFEDVGKFYIMNLFDEPKKLVILFDRSSGTAHDGAKEKLIALLQKHIENGLAQRTLQKYDSTLTHILASNFTEGLLEIARHYQNRAWAENMLDLLTQIYYKGVNSL